MDFSLPILLLLSTAASLAAASSPERHSESGRMVEEGEFILSSMDAHEKRDLDALLSFRKVITRDPWGELTNWTAENSEKMCSWSGIRCRRHSKRVVAIDLLPSDLEGNLSPSLGNLSLLGTLRLAANSLTGRIPSEFGMLKALRLLDLSWNMIEGSIPVELGLLHRLEYLDLSQTLLSGSIPGARSFNRGCLYHIGDTPNPYEQAISIIGRTLSAFDEGNLIPCFGFGDGKFWSLYFD